MVRGGNGGLLRGDQRRQGRRAGGSRPQGGSGWQGAALGGAGGSGTPVGKGRRRLAGQGQQRLVRGASGWLLKAGTSGSGEGCRWRIAGAGQRRQARGGVGSRARSGGGWQAQGSGWQAQGGGHAHAGGGRRREHSDGAPDLVSSLHKSLKKNQKMGTGNSRTPDRDDDDGGEGAPVLSSRWRGGARAGGEVLAEVPMVVGSRSRVVWAKWREERHTLFLPLLSPTMAHPPILECGGSASAGGHFFHPYTPIPGWRIG